MSVCICVFFFKQKTAYEMRISDWSSEVCSADLYEVPERIDVPRTGEMDAMGFARENDGFELGVGQGAVGDQPGRQDRTIRWSGRGDRGHRRRLDQRGRMRFRVGDTKRLERIGLVDRIG